MSERTSVERSPADVLRLAVAAALLLVALLVEWLFGDTLVTFASDLLRGLDALPDWLVAVVVVGTRVLWLVVIGGGLVLTVARGRWRLLGTAAAAGALAALLAVVLDGLDLVEPGEVATEPGVDLSVLTRPGFPGAAGIAVTTAVLTAAAPWLSRRWRRAGWLLVVGLAVTRFLLVATSFDTLRAALVGWVSGAAMLVLLGAPSRRPTSASIAAGLADVGLPLASLEAASVDARGSTPYFGVDAGGGRLFVKALGDDERSADLLFRLYRRVQPRDLGDEKPFSTLRRGVEHEALVALVARDLGIRTPRLRAFATAEPNGYVLAYDAIAGRSLDRLDPADVDDELLAAIWRLVSELREHRIAHRDLRLANIFVGDDGEVWLIDFGFSELAASDLLLANDVAELTASSSAFVGPERAVAHAATAVDRVALAQALDRLHPWALGGATRTALRARPGLLDELRRLIAAAAEGTRTGETTVS